MGLVLLSLLMTSEVHTATLPFALPAETLSGKKLTIPSDLAKKPILFVIGFSEASKTQTSAWSRDLNDKPYTDEVVVYSVSVIEDAPKFVRGFVANSIRKSVPKARHDQFLLISLQASEWKKMGSYQEQEPDNAYLVLMDVAREVVWRVSGPVTEEKLQTLTDELKPRATETEKPTS